MAKTETNVSTLKINRGTYAKVQENLSSITENELIITSDKNVPIPTTNDNGKAVVVNASGEYELGNAGMSQTDADARYLQLSGGTMTGTIRANVSSILRDNQNHVILSSNSGVTTLGHTSNDLTLTTLAGNIIHNKNGTTCNVLDSSNTEANPTLAGTESALTGLKVNGTNYAVPEGYEAHTYTAKTYTTSDSDYEQLRDDINNGRMIRIGIWIYQQIYNNGSLALYANTYRETATSLNTSSVSISLNFASITISSSISLSMPKVQADANIGNNLTPSLYIGTALYSMVGTQTAYTTTAPTADNTSGYLQTVVLTSEPATYYNGYYYVILSSNA